MGTFFVNIKKLFNKNITSQYILKALHWPVLAAQRLQNKFSYLTGLAQLLHSRLQLQVWAAGRKSQQRLSPVRKSRPHKKRIVLHTRLQKFQKQKQTITFCRNPSIFKYIHHLRVWHAGNTSDYQPSELTLKKKRIYFTHL